MKFVSCLTLALLSVAGAKPNDVSGCIMSNTNAINSLVDSALFIYVTNRNCKSLEDDAGVCIKDLASVVNSVAGVAEFLVKVFKTCGEIKMSNYDCAIAGTKMTGALSSITANTAAATLDCPIKGPNHGNKPWTYAGADTCNVFIGSAMSGLQTAISSIMAVKGKCGGKHAKAESCVGGVLDIISAVANLATFIENLASKCSHGAVDFGNGCESDIAGILGGLAGTAAASTQIREDCIAESTRLYEEDAVTDESTFGSANVMSAMLVVFLPITGLASYFCGSRLTKVGNVRRVERVQASGEMSALVA